MTKFQLSLLTMMMICGGSNGQPVLIDKKDTDRVASRMQLVSTSARPVDIRHGALHNQDHDLDTHMAVTTAAIPPSGAEMQQVVRDQNMVEVQQQLRDQDLVVMDKFVSLHDTSITIENDGHFNINDSLWKVTSHPWEPGNEDTLSMFEKVSRIVTDGGQKRVCIIPDLLNDQAKTLFKLSQPKTWKKWEKHQCAPPWIYPYLHVVEVDMVMRKYQMTKEDEDVGKLLRSFGLDIIDEKDHNMKFVNKTLKMMKEQLVLSYPKMDRRNKTLLHRKRRTPFMDINLSLNLNNMGEINLFRWQWQKMGEILRDTPSPDGPSFHGKPIQNAQSILGTDAPSTSQ